MGRSSPVSRFLGPFAVAAFMNFLAACGGGGGGGEVTPPPVQPVALVIGGVPTAAMTPRETARLTATLSYSDGSMQDVTVTAAWSTTDPAVLSASAAGTIAAVSQGTAEVVASTSGLSSRVRVRVRGAAAAELAAFAGGAVDGVGASARFYHPGGLTTDAAGNIYVADSSSSGLLGHQLIRKITPAGQVSTLAGTAQLAGYRDGVGEAALFNEPNAVAIDDAGNVFVADRGPGRIRKLAPGGTVTTVTDATGTLLPLSEPQGVVIDSQGNLFVADSGHHVVRKITAAGVVSIVAGREGQVGSVDGVGSNVLFGACFSPSPGISVCSGPSGIAMDSIGNLYVTDQLNHTVRRIAADGVVSTLAGAAGLSGSVDGLGTAARFDHPYGIAADASGNVYVADKGNQTIRKITSAGDVSTLAGTTGAAGSRDGAAAEAQFNFPEGVSVDTSGNVYVADTMNHTIRRISPAGIVTTLAGSAGRAGSAGTENGFGLEARFGSSPGPLAVDSDGNVLVVDSANASIRRITRSGAVSTIVGGVPGARGVAADGAGNLFLSNPYEHTVQQITPDGAVRTFAGAAGQAGSADGVGSDARFNRPEALAIDRHGNIYVADEGNYTIRKITPGGVVSTLAGSAGQKGNTDGTGAQARFSAPLGVATDSAGNVYSADTGNHTIRRITAAGVVSTLAGAAGITGSADGGGTAARFSSPKHVAVDAAGNIYVADTGNYTVRKVSPAGLVTTVVGRPGQAGFLPGGLPGLLPYVTGLAMDGSSLYLALSPTNTVAIVNNAP